jgi:hypothetical protein
MFIRYNDNRINISTVKRYIPSQKRDTNGETLYSITLEFIDSSSQELNFIHDEERKNLYLKFLDENFLIEPS